MKACYALCVTVFITIGLIINACLLLSAQDNSYWTELSNKDHFTWIAVKIFSPLPLDSFCDTSAVYSWDAITSLLQLNFTPLQGFEHHHHPHHSSFISKLQIMSLWTLSMINQNCDEVSTEWKLKVLTFVTTSCLSYTTSTMKQFTDSAVQTCQPPINGVHALIPPE